MELAKRSGITQERALRLYEYRPDGTLFSRIKKRKIGYLHRSGYLYTTIDHRCYAVHSIIFLMHRGRLPLGIPNGVMDHINRDKQDNRIENLREVSMSGNAINRAPARGTTLCPVTKRKWIAQIKIHGRAIQLGRFDDEESAHQAYLDAKEIYHKIEELR